MKTDADYRAQLLLWQNVFAGKLVLSKEETKHFAKISKYSLDNPIYSAETGLCVMAPDGTFVSGCKVLIDTWNLEADIERVCTHSGFRWQGLPGLWSKNVCIDWRRWVQWRLILLLGTVKERLLYISLGYRKRTEFFIYKQKNETGLQPYPAKSVAATR